MVRDMTSDGRRHDLRRFVADEEEQMYPWRSDMRPNSSSGLQFHAQPFGDGPGFYFDSLEDYEKKYEANFKKNHLEEYEIQFIDGENWERLVFEGMQVSQGNLDEYFDALDELEDEHSKVAFLFLLDVGKDAEDALAEIGNVQVSGGDLENAAYELLEDVGISDDLADQYFDYESFGRDLRISGDLTNSLEDDLESARSDEDEDEVERLEEEIERLESLSDRELAEDFVDSIGSLKDAVGKDSLARYFDYEAFGRDMNLNGEWAEFRVDGTDYVITNALEF